MTSPKDSDLEKILLSNRTKMNDPEWMQILVEQYKLFVETSERLVARRQHVNTFLLSANTIVSSAIGLVLGLLKNGENLNNDNVAVICSAIAVSGICLCVAWIKLVKSFTQINTGKFKVIHLIEKHLPAAIFKTEWVALGKGNSPKIYTPFTKTEKWIPLIFIALYIGVAVVLWGNYI